jgi:hypothetical protein
MSSDPSASEPQPTTTAEEGTNPVRLVVLLLIFGLALAGLLYDYTIARPAVQKADQLIQGCFSGQTEDPDDDGTYTDDEIQMILQRKPAETEDLSNGKIEIYTWRSGLPFRDHTLYVVYVGRNHPLLHFASMTRPDQTQLPPVTKLADPPTQEELDNFVPMGPSGAGGEGAGGKKKGRGRSREGRSDKDDTQQEPAPQSDAPATDQEPDAQPEPDKPAASEQSDQTH